MNTFRCMQFVVRIRYTASLLFVFHFLLLHSVLREIGCVLNIPGNYS